MLRGSKQTCVFSSRREIGWDDGADASTAHSSTRPSSPQPQPQHSHGCRLLILPRVRRYEDDSSSGDGGRCSGGEWRPVLSASESLAVRTSQRDGRGSHASNRPQHERNIKWSSILTRHFVSSRAALRCAGCFSLLCLTVCRLFWSQEMEIAVLGLGNAGKSSFVHVINVSATTKSTDEGCRSMGQRDGRRRMHFGSRSRPADATRHPSLACHPAQWRRTAAAYAPCEGDQLRENKHVHLRRLSRACTTRHRPCPVRFRRRRRLSGLAGPTPQLQIAPASSAVVPHRYSFHSSRFYSCASALLLCCDGATLYCLCRSPPSDRRVQGEHDGHRWIQHAQGAVGQG